MLNVPWQMQALRIQYRFSSRILYTQESMAVFAAAFAVWVERFASNQNLSNPFHTWR